ncbi:ABC transporter permease [Thermodesulfobacteriota bacterium]
MTSTWLKIAVANILKNKRRSFYTIIAIAFGFAAVNIFGGFTEYIFRNLKGSFVYALAHGHLTVYKKDFLTEGQIDPLKYLITENELDTIQDICAKDSRIVIATPQLQIMGLLSNGIVSTIFIGMGGVPSAKKIIQSRAGGMVGKLKFYEGKSLEDDIIYGAGLTRGLAKKLKLYLGSDAIAMSPTLDGRINAMDLQVFHLFRVQVDELNDKVLYVNIKFAQTLYDTDSVDRIIILLDKDENIESVKAFLEKAFVDKGLQMEVKNWRELSPFYTKVKDMFDIIFIILFVIVFIIVVASVTNTISMSVIERTREIGTLRALGLKRKGVVTLFAMESALLNILGCISGICLTILNWIMFNVFKPQWVPPNIPRKVPLEIYLVPSYMAKSFGFLLLLSIIVALLVARQAARKSIVGALGHI